MDRIENRDVGRILLSCFLVTLKSLKLGLTQYFRIALKSVCSFVDFSLFCHLGFYKDHTIEYIRSYLLDCDEQKVISLEFVAHKMAKAPAAKIGSLVRTTIANLDRPLRQ